MERVAFLIEETGERISCMLNPESLTVRRTAGIGTRRSLGGNLTGVGLTDDTLLYTGGGMTEMDLELLFEVAIPDDPATITPDVRSLTAPLWQLAENTHGGNDNYGLPDMVRFLWGKSWNILGVVAAVSEHLDFFDSTGIPLRSWLKMRFLRVTEKLKEDIERAPLPVEAFPNQSLPDDLAREAQTVTETPNAEVKLHQYVAGQRLDQLVRENYGFYGHPSLWRLIAAYNGISDPLNIDIGKIIQFPPISVLENK
jgi:hypothetical protein